jgi:hypothetical protein
LYKLEHLSPPLTMVVKSIAAFVCEGARADPSTGARQARRRWLESLWLVSPVRMDVMRALQYSAQ